jgi:hypothetical protein
MSDSPAEPTESAPGGMRCDFCGQVVPRVRRIALDSGYDRLQVRHAERYACPSCSEKKERQRVGLDKR